MAVILTYNINGIRAALNKNLDSWIDSSKADIVCLQEIKAKPEQFNVEAFNKLGFECFINSAEKPGYSGVAILSKLKPKNVEYGCGIEKIDFEGRVIRADYDNYSVMSVYFPSGSNPLRQAFKMEFLDLFYDYIQELKKTIPNLIISGDYNICHKAIDIHDPIRNSKVSGFLPWEREWISDFIDLGFIDSFRKLNKDPDRYSWWSYRANSRANNKGWRIDYNLVSDTLNSNIKSSSILDQIFHSDHCPIVVELNL